MLDEAARTHTDAWWWVKADGCDLLSGLGESTRLQWSGDVNLNDGELEKLYETYKSNLTFVSEIGLKERRNPTVIKDDMVTSTKLITEDMSFLCTG